MGRYLGGENPTVEGTEAPIVPPIDLPLPPSKIGNYKINQSVEIKH